MTLGLLAVGGGNLPVSSTSWGGPALSVPHTAVSWLWVAVGGWRRPVAGVVLGRSSCGG